MLRKSPAICSSQSEAFIRCFDNANYRGQHPEDNLKLEKYFRGEWYEQ